VIQLDVGQGDAALVLGPTTGLIDAGSAHTLGDAEWIKSFALAGISKLDWVALTHLDEDHRGGLERLARLVPIGCAATSWQELHTERGQEIARKLLAHGVHLEAWEAGCIPYPTHGPFETGQGAQAHRAIGNSNMSAILIPLQSDDFYFSAGDAESEDETRFARWADLLSKGRGLRILKVSHHGSNTSSDPKTLQIFHPDFAIISVGLGNSYGHPAKETLSRFLDANIPVYRTDRDGPIRVEAFHHRPQEHLP
jgi:competence protein ComEC